LLQPVAPRPRQPARRCGGTGSFRGTRRRSWARSRKSTCRVGLRARACARLCGMHACTHMPWPCGEPRRNAPS
jgi:hypothetical protein